MKKVLISLIACLVIVCFAGCNYKYKEVVKAVDKCKENFDFYYKTDEVKKIESDGKHFEVYTEMIDQYKIIDVDLIDYDSEYYITDVCKALRKHGYPDAVKFRDDCIIIQLNH
ncbi:MAG: hypothetical protein PUF10_02910 [Bacteroidales bacterium]|nr:hypothetical protein [Bacteroidales bacterium]